MGVQKSTVGRAAAILTTGEVAAETFDLTNAGGSELLADLRFTLGSLTNGIFRFYALDPDDGTTWVPLADLAGNVSYTFTASTTRMIWLRAPGVKSVRVTVQGTGTVTSSSATVTYRYKRPGAL
jgi:hypothetical protein